MKKYIPFIVIVILVCYAIFDFVSKESMLNSTMKNEDKTEQSSEQEVVEELSDHTTGEDLTETGHIESGQTLPEVEFAPGFELSDMNGVSVNLSDLKGKIVILNFWATWCPPCRDEMPHMQSFYEKKKDDGIEIIAVNLTNQDVGRQAIEQFVQDFGLTFPILLDEDGYVGTMYEVMTIPTSYILDEEGRIFQKVVGPMDEQIINDMVDSIRMYDEK